MIERTLKHDECAFTASVAVIVNPDEFNKKAKVIESIISLKLSNNLNPIFYLDSKNVLTGLGTQAITIALIEGLLGNIKVSHELNHRNADEHLKWIIQELRKRLPMLDNSTIKTNSQGTVMPGDN